MFRCYLSISRNANIRAKIVRARNIVAAVGRENRRGNLDRMVERTRHDNYLRTRINGRYLNSRYNASRFEA